MLKKAKNKNLINIEKQSPAICCGKIEKIYFLSKEVNDKSRNYSCR